MKHADLSELRDRIVDLARDTAVGKLVESVAVEADEDDGGFLRVIFQMKDIEKVKAEEVQPLVRSIEDLVAEVDERFPSVRFAEAA
jgi:hypothetical protein